MTEELIFQLFIKYIHIFYDFRRRVDTPNWWLTGPDRTGPVRATSHKTVHGGPTGCCAPGVEKTQRRTAVRTSNVTQMTVYTEEGWSCICGCVNSDSSWIWTAALLTCSKERPCIPSGQASGARRHVVSGLCRLVFPSPLQSYNCELNI